MNRELLVNVIWWVLFISFGRFLSYFGSHFVSGRRSVAGYTTDETYKMEAKEPERWQKVNIPSMSTQTVGINRTHLNSLRGMGKGNYKVLTMFRNSDSLRTSTFGKL